jgi:hypothetical protein
MGRQSLAVKPKEGMMKKHRRELWGEGPWQAEPDRVEWRHAGYPCLMIRHDTYGHWCGYVGVPETHPDYGKDYDEPEVEVHGGLTYARACRGDVCHVPEPGESDHVWWFGFDCAHAWDISPGLRLGGMLPESTYRDLPYVKAETNKLAEQLHQRRKQ